MSSLNTFLNMLKKNPSGIGDALVNKLNRAGKLRWMSDEQFLKLKYRTAFGHKLDLNNPITFNAKLQWLKLYDRRPEYITYVDKYRVREFVAEKIGQEYLIPLLGRWDNAEDIDFDSLPEQFVLKCNHDSGCVIICKNKAVFDKEKARARLAKQLKKNLYWHAREWPYKDVKPCIIAEKYMEDMETGELRDYKFFAFSGQVRALFVATDRQTPGEETKFDFFDTEFNHLPIKQGHPNAEKPPAEPKKLKEMIFLAQELSKGIPQLRVDFYEVNGKVYFGELTFSHYSGFVPFEPKSWDETFGNWIQLPEKKRN